MAIEFKKIKKISKALGDVNRLKILDQECVNLAQPSISHHVKILIEAELIDSEKEGRNHKYVLNIENFNAYFKGIEKLVEAQKTSNQKKL